ncbi:radical SAM/SPASM domain-containing protein [Gemmiger sp.]
MRRHAWPELFGDGCQKRLEAVGQNCGTELADCVLLAVPLQTVPGDDVAIAVPHETGSKLVKNSWHRLTGAGESAVWRIDVAALKPDDENAEFYSRVLPSLTPQAAELAPQVQKCLQALPAESPSFAQMGAVEGGLQIVTMPLTLAQAADYLKSIDWAGDSSALNVFFAALAPQMNAKALRLDFTLTPTGVAAPLGVTVESRFGWGRRMLCRWLDFLQQNSLCTPAKAQGVLQWFDTPMQYSPTVQCNVSHFRICLQKDGRQESTVYLRLSQQPTRIDYDRYDSPVTMNLELTSRCPLHCPQCYCDLTHGKDLDLDTALYWIDQAHQNHVQNVNLSGGETMVYPHLLTLIEACAKRGMQANIAISGYGITREVLEEIIQAGVGGIFVSLNGSTKEIGSKSRDGYDLAIHALELLRDVDFDRVHINWVMHNNNADDFANMPTLCEKYKVPNLSVMVFKPDSSHQLPSAPTGAQIRAVAEIIRQYKGPVHFDIEGCFSQMRALVYQGFLGNVNQGVGHGCLAGTAAISINVDGKITPCRHLEIPEETRTIREYWENSPTLAALRAAAQNPQEPCQSCKLQKYCLPCMAFNVKIHGKIYYGTKECPLAGTQ